MTKIYDLEDELCRVRAELKSYKKIKTELQKHDSVDGESSASFAAAAASSSSSSDHLRHHRRHGHQEKRKRQHHQTATSDRRRREQTEETSSSQQTSSKVSLSAISENKKYESQASNNLKSVHDKQDGSERVVSNSDGKFSTSKEIISASNATAGDQEFKTKAEGLPSNASDELPKKTLYCRDEAHNSKHQVIRG